MNKNVKKIIGRLLAATGLIILVLCFSPSFRSALAQGVTSTAQNVFGDLFSSSLVVQPNGNAFSLTNGLTVYDTTLTNYSRINPTNAALYVFRNNTNFFPLLDADIIYTNNAGTTRHLIIKNGQIGSTSTF
jgi:hypothetical protein